MSGKIDICVVTRGDKMPKGLENIPINKLIVETSKPLGEARRRAIAQVETRARLRGNHPRALACPDIGFKWF